MEKSAENTQEIKISALHHLEKFTNSKIIFEGIVEKFEKIETRNGRIYGKVLIKDNTDSYQIYLFGKNFQTFHSIIKEKVTLKVKAEVNKTFGERLFLNILSINNGKNQINKNK